LGKGRKGTASKKPGWEGGFTEELERRRNQKVLGEPAILGAELKHENQALNLQM